MDREDRRCYLFLRLRIVCQQERVAEGFLFVNFLSKIYINSDAPHLVIFYILS